MYLNKPKVYLGGPMPHPNLGKAWRDSAREDLYEHYTVVNPLESQSIDDKWEIRSRVMVDQDLHAVRGSDIVIFNFSEINLGEYPGIGSLCELGYAYAHEKLIYVVSGGEEWIERHPFVLRMATYIFPTLDDLMSHLLSKRSFFTSISS